MSTPTDETAAAPPPAKPEQRENLLVVEGVAKHFPIKSGLLRRTTGVVQAVDGVDFDGAHAARPSRSWASPAAGRARRPAW